MSSRGGLLCGLGAYALWGLFPLYFPLLAPAGAVEVLTQRVLWSLVACALLVGGLSLWQRRRRTTTAAGMGTGVGTGTGTGAGAAAGTGGGSGAATAAEEVRALLRRPRDVGLLALAALLISANWLAFIHLTLAGRVVEASLGYYINPLVVVALGVVLLRERLRRLQWAALALGALAVVVLTIEVGHPPWIALSLAVSFGLYGFVKKRVGRGVGAISGLTVETALLAPVAAGVLALLLVSGRATLLTEGPGHLGLLALSGVVTAVPLLLFGAAAARLRLSTVGLLQYLTPTLQLLVGVLVLGEPVSGLRWAGFAVVWLALVVFTVDTLRAAGGRRSSPAAAPVGGAPPL